MKVDDKEFISPSFETEIRVRYAETDKMGVVYYGNYYTWYEVARGDALRKVGYPYSALEEDGILLPVTESYSRYMAPIRYDELIVVATKIEELRAVSISFVYEIFRASDRKLCTKGFTKHAMLDKNGKLLRPDGNNAALEKLKKMLCEYIETNAKSS